jgi:hypothetical protein
MRCKKAEIGAPVSRTASDLSTDSSEEPENLLVCLLQCSGRLWYNNTCPEDIHHQGGDFPFWSLCTRRRQVVILGVGDVRRR